MASQQLPAEKLRAVCDASVLGCESTADITPVDGVVGQERAVRSLDFGLSIPEDGYNIYVAGIPGSGRTTSVEAAVKKLAEKRATPDDWCYVYNFSNPDTPKCLRFPPGKAIDFRRDMETVVDELKIEVPKAFESKMYEEQKNQIIRQLQKFKEDMFNQLAETAKQASFVLQGTPTGFVFVPAVEGKPLSDEEIEQLTDEAKKDIRTKQEILYEQLSEVLREVRQEERATREKIQNLNNELTLATVKPRIEEVREKYREFPDVLRYLDDVQRDMVEHAEDFQEKKETEILPGVKIPSRENGLFKYKVNVLVDNSKTRGAPVIREIQPTCYNLTGRIEYRPSLGAMFTDFTMIKPGALHLANGGYLILNVMDVLRNYFSWEALKQTIKNKNIRIEDLNEQFRLINTPTLKPEPIPADVKIILIGSPLIYYLLHAYDEDFPKLFKVRADFSSIMDRDEEGIRQYAAFVSRACKQDNLREFERDAIGKVVEYGSRLVEDQRKLSTRFMEIVDLLKEANYWAEKEGAERVKASHVMKAVEEKVYRSNLIEERIGELIREGTIMVDTDGAKIGQVNGLSVINLGDYQFGKPSRITATTSIGRQGLVNIEREIKMAGAIHNKGFMILKGLFAEKFGRRNPLVFSSTICFEQVYEEIDGDSASSTEYYALISSIAGIPIRQDIAVTGSINQKGEIQPIGGVNEKIEGFYVTCKAKGLTGKQGVLIPGKNIRNLMLKEEVVEAVRKGQFHIWTADTVDEGIEILTGVPAGAIQEDGSYPEGTVNYLVAEKLLQLTRAFHKAEKKTSDTGRKKKRN